MLKRAFATLVLLAVSVAPAFAAMTVKEFRKFTKEQQFIYLGAAVSMLAYTYASEGNPAKGRCIQNWWAGEPGKPAQGPQAIAAELAVAEARDADKFTVEGLILGIIDQVCAKATSAPPR